MCSLTRITNRTIADSIHKNINQDRSETIFHSENVQEMMNNGKIVEKSTSLYKTSLSSDNDPKTQGAETKDNSDVENFTKNRKKEIKEGDRHEQVSIVFPAPSWSCVSGTQRVAYSLLCDHHRDCQDGSDEDCEFESCTGDTPLQCHTMSQVRKKFSSFYQ